MLNNTFATGEILLLFAQGDDDELRDFSHLNLFSLATGTTNKLGNSTISEKLTKGVQKQPMKTTQLYSSCGKIKIKTHLVVQSLFTF